MLDMMSGDERQAKLKKLAADDGFQDVGDFLASESCFVWGICINPNCDLTTDCESEAEDDWCDSCNANTIVSGIALDCAGEGREFEKILVKRKLLKLAQSQGLETAGQLVESLDRGEVQGPVPGICMRSNCDHIDMVEPSAMAAWCTECEQHTTQSVLELKNEID